jgi:hypothetical protein
LSSASRARPLASGTNPVEREAEGLALAETGARSQQDEQRVARWHGVGQRVDPFAAGLVSVPLGIECFRARLRVMSAFPLEAAFELLTALSAGGLVGVLGQLGFAGIFALPVSIGVAVLKYRLWEIDRIISRTVAYAIVTGLLVGVYAGLVLLATHVLSFHSSVAVAASTLGGLWGHEIGQSRGQVTVKWSIWRVGTPAVMSGGVSTGRRVNGVLSATSPCIRGPGGTAPGFRAGIRARATPATEQPTAVRRAL